MSSEIEDSDWEDDFEWLDNEIAEELEASSGRMIDDLNSDKPSQSLSDSHATSQSDQKLGVKSLFNFISSLQQMEYNFYGKLARPCDFAYIKEIISSNIETADIIADSVGYKKNSLGDLYYYNILLRQVSYLESSAREGSASFNAFIKSNGKETLDELIKVNTSGVIYLEDELSSNEISLHIKSALLPYALYYEAFIQRVSKKNKSDLEEFILAIVSLTKDISSNWSKKSNISDKAMLFITCLPIVARFALQFTEGYIESRIETKLNGHTFKGHDVYSAIEESDGGFMDYPEKRDILYESIAKSIQAEIDVFVSSHWNQTKLFPRDKAKLIILENLHDVWLNFCQQEVIEFKGLDDKEREKYISRNKNTINTEMFYRMLAVCCKDTLNNYFTVDINWKEVEKGLREKFAIYWGVSDAVFKKR